MCYDGHPNPHAYDGTSAAMDVSDAAHKPDGPQWPPSEPQVAYVIGLQQERALPDEYWIKSDDDIRAMEKDEVSRLIGELKALPYKNPKGRGQAKNGYTMPAGRYAVEDAIGSVTLFQVDKPKEGRWAGYTFIKRLIGAPGSYRKQEVQDTVRYSILDRIQADPKAAMIAYGKHETVCGRCSSPLTNGLKPDDPKGPDGLTSVERGIGPVCMFKKEW